MNTPSASPSPAAPHSSGETGSENGNESSPINVDIEFEGAPRGTRPTVHVQRMHEDVEMPRQENPLDAALDLRAFINAEGIDPSTQALIIPSGENALVPTGLKVALPRNLEMQIRPRSGLASEGIVVANSPGTVDPGYRGEVRVLLENRSGEPFAAETGDRIAQAAIRPVVRPSFEEVDEMPTDTDRGEGGFGSTGV